MARAVHAVQLSGCLELLICCGSVAGASPSEARVSSAARRQAVTEYLQIRRAVGYKLERDGQLLPDFVEFLDRAGAERVTNELAVAWAMAPATAHPAWWRQRLSIVRGFAGYLQTIDPASEVPPAELVRAHRRRMTPYLYAQADIAALLDAADELRPPLRAATTGRSSA